MLLVEGNETTREIRKYIQKLLKQLTLFDTENQLIKLNYKNQTYGPRCRDKNIY